MQFLLKFEWAIIMFVISVSTSNNTSATIKMFTLQFSPIEFVSIDELDYFQQQIFD